MEITFTGENNGLTVPYYMLIGGIMVVYETLIDASNPNTQGPTVLDTPHQITYGAALNSASDPVQLLADGSILINEGGSYVFTFGSTPGRTGSAGIAEMFLRILLNGTQIGDSVHIQLTDAEVLTNRSTTVSAALPIGTVVTVEMIREASGNNSGDLVAGLPSPGGWNAPASATVSVGRWVIPA